MQQTAKGSGFSHFPAVFSIFLGIISTFNNDNKVTNKVHCSMVKPGVTVEIVVKTH